MAEKIVIAQLDIDVQALIKSTSDVKKKLDELMAVQSALKKSGDTSSKAFVENAAAIKSLSTEYGAGIRAINEYTNTTVDSANRGKIMALTLDQEAKSIKELREQNKALNKLRNETNLTTEEGQKELKLLNDKLDENNKIIKANVDEYAKQKIEIGNYKTAIKDAISETSFMGMSVNSVSQNLKPFGAAFNSIKTSLAGYGSQIRNSAAGTEGMNTANKAWAIGNNIVTGSLGILKIALAAVGIGLIVTAIILLVGYFKTFTPLIDKFGQITAGVGAAVRVLQQTLVNLFSSLKNIGAFLANPIEGFKKLGSEMAAAAEAAAKLEKANQDLKDAQEVQSVANKKQEAEIARLMLQAKDRGKTEAERIALLEKAEKINEQNFKKNKELSDQEYANAVENARIKGALKQSEIEALQQYGLAYAKQLEDAGKITEEDVKMVEEAEVRKIEIYNRATAEQEKIINRTNALKEKQEADAQKAAEDAKRAAEKAIAERQKIIDAAIEKSKQELDLYIATEGGKANSLKKSLDFEAQVRDKSLAILKKELDGKKITQLQYDTQVLQTKEEYLQRENELRLEYASAELDNFIANNVNKLDNEKNLTQALIDEEAKRLEYIRSQKLEQLAIEKQTNDAIIAAKIAANEQLSVADLEYMTEKANIENEVKAQVEANNEQLAQQEKDRKAEQLAIDREVELALAATKYEEDVIAAEAKAQDELDRYTKWLEQKKITQEQYDALSVASEQKASEMKRLSRIQETEDGLNQIGKTIGGLQTLFGKNKAFATATALVNGGLAVTEILKAPTAPFIEPQASIIRGVQIAAVVATTARNVLQINKAKFEKGGLIPIQGKSHAQGGEDVYIGGQYIGEAEAGEGVGIMNKKAFASFMNFNNSFGGGKGMKPGYFESGAIISREITDRGIDINELAQITANAVASQPRPIVDVKDIVQQVQSYTTVVNGANF